MQQPEAARALLDLARARGLSTLMFSGYTHDEIRALPGGPDVLARLDVLIDGRYVAGERLATGLRGSANQRIHLLTSRYTLADVEATPVAEIRIGRAGEVVLTGVDPLKLRGTIREMTELPPPDLMDQSGRARRLVLALLVAAGVGALVYGFTYKLSDPDHQATTGAFKFVFYMTGFAAMAAFIVTLKIANWRADKKYREQLVAQAKVVK